MFVDLNLQTLITEKERRETILGELFSTPEGLIETKPDARGCLQRAHFGISLEAGNVAAELRMLKMLHRPLLVFLHHAAP